MLAEDTQRPNLDRSLVRSVRWLLILRPLCIDDLVALPSAASHYAYDSLLQVSCSVRFDCSLTRSLSHSHSFVRSFVRSLVLPIGRGIRTLIFCFSAGEQRKCYYCQSEPGGDRILPAVYESSPSETPLLVASSFSTLLRVYAQRLASGYYRIHPYVHARRIIQRADRCATIGNAMMLLSYLLTSLAL